MSEPVEPVRLEPPASLSMPLGEAMFTQRAIRRLDPDRPISDEDLHTIVDAASKAPTGGNEQPVRLLVVRDRTRIEQFGPLYHEAWWAKRADAYGWTVDQELPEDSPYRPAAGLASEIGRAPVVVLVFSTGAPGFSVFPAVQNLLLAARGLGIGSVLDDAASHRDGPGAPPVPGPSRRPVPLLCAARVPARQLRAHEPAADPHDDLLGHLGYTAALVMVTAPTVRCAVPPAPWWCGAPAPAGTGWPPRRQRRLGW